MSTNTSNPYIGPRPFKKNEAKRFFGRDREARDLLALVSSQRLVLFYASSGAGKSSLINARLIDALVGRGFEVLPVGRVSGVLPRETGIDLSRANVFGYFLKQSLAEFCLDDTLSEADQRFFQAYAGAPLSDFLLRLAQAGQNDEGNDRYVFTTPETADAVVLDTPIQSVEEELRPRALIVDQFEEIFTTNLQAWEQRGDFFSQLRQAMEDDPYLWVVLAMREDFIANLDPLAHLLPGELHARYYMQRMGYDAALDAVKKPVETQEPAEWHRPFAPGTAERLVDNLRQVHVTTEEGEGVATAIGEFIEPVQLQVVCYQLWEQLRDTPGTEITDADLDRLAGGQDLSVFVDRALGEFYELALRRVLERAGSLTSEVELRRWFSERLITEAGTRGFVYRGESETGGLPNEVVRLLAAEFLIRSESRAGGTWYELSHDRFVDPIQRSNQRWSLEQLQRDPLLRRAHEWAASHDDPAQRDQRLLLSDEELASLDLGGRAPEAVVHDFLDASRRAKEQRDLLATQDQLKETRQREQAEKRTARRMRLLAGLAALMAVSALVAWLVVFLQAGTLRDTNAELTTSNTDLGHAVATAEASTKAEKAAKEQAETANLIAQSLMLANQSLDSSSLGDALLLARAATAYSPTLLAQTALLDALDRSYRLDGRMAVYVPPERLELGEGGPWEAVAFSGDGGLLALGDSTGGITLWDNTTDERVGERLVLHGEDPVYTLAFDPTGPRLVSTTEDRNAPAVARHNLVLWDLADPEHPTPRVLAADQPTIWSAAWSPDGQRLAVANQDGTVDIWQDLAETEPISRTLPGRHADWAFSVAFSPDGDRLASAGRDGKIILWDDVTGSSPVSQTLDGPTAWVTMVAFSPDGTQLAAGSDSGTVRLWDLTQDPPSELVLDNRTDLGAQVWSVAFDPERGRWLATGWSDGSLRVYDVEQPDAAPWQLAGHSGTVNSLAFDPAAPQRLVSVSPDDEDYAPIAWNLAAPSEFASVQPFTAPVTATLKAMSPNNGRWLAVAGDQRTVFVGETMNSSPAITITAGMTITAAAFSANGARLALAGCAGTLNEAPSGLSTTATLTKTVDVTQAAAAAAAGKRLTGCKLTVWSLDPALPVSTTHTISSTAPIVAVAFRPQRPDQMALALEGGAVQTYNLSTSLTVNLPSGVPEAVDLAFTSDGSQLAALGRSGSILIWDWASQSLIEDYSFDDAQEGRLFDAIEFVQGDAWLALASNTTSNGSQLELRERKTRQAVQRFSLDSARAVDLVFDPGSRSLTWLQPDGLARWPLDLASWLKLACTRAGRNLSYDAWRVAFPSAASDDTSQSLVCPTLPLDRSYAAALVTEARTRIDDCRPNQLAEGMTLLETASTMKVYPPLKLDPRAFALDVLGQQAWEKLQQPSGLYDEQALACLQRAAEQLSAASQPAFDPQQALQAGQRLVQAERLLADAQAGAGPMVDALEEILGSGAPWPDDFLRERALTMLPQAYYRLCQQADEEGCRRFAAVADLIQYGDTVTGEYQSGVENPLYFQGQRGQAVTIAMNAVNNAFDTLVRLESSDGVLITDDDSGPDANSLISNFLLPADGIFRIIPTAYSGQGSYRLSLQSSTPRPIALGAVESSTTAQDGLWQFEGQAGQLVAIAMDDADPNFDPFLRLISPEYTLLKTDSDSGGNYNALLIATLPADGVYFASAEGCCNEAAYTLRVFEPRPLPFDLPQTSTTLSNTLWMLDSAGSQVIDLAITPSGGMTGPRLTLRNANGDYLAQGIDLPATDSERIPAYILPSDSGLLVQVDPAGSARPYTLTLTSRAARPLVFDQPATSTTQAAPIWTFSGTAGQVVDITLNSSGRTFDPELALLNAAGVEIKHDYDSGGDLNARIAALILPADDQYFVRPLPAGSPVSYTLALSAVAPQAITPGHSETSTLRENTLWAFNGTAGQPIDVAVAVGTGESPSVALWTESGQALTEGGQYLRDPDASSIDGYILPQTGRYFVRVGNLNQTTRYSLSLSEANTRPIEIGTAVPSTTISDTLWTLNAVAGQALAIAMSTTDLTFDPYLTVHSPSGVNLASADYGGDGYNARISIFVVPATGRYIVRAGLPGSAAPYTLSVQAVQPPQIRFGEAKTSDTQTTELWQFAGQAGQVVDIDLSGWVRDDYDPYLTLYGPDGSQLAQHDDIRSDEPIDYNARIASFLLPQTGPYYIQTGRSGSDKPYRLTLRQRAATPAVLGSRLQAIQSSAYTLPVDQTTLLRLNADGPAGLTLVGPGAALLASQAPAILRQVQATGNYTIGVTLPSGSPARWLNIERVQATVRPLDADGESQGRLRVGATDLWRLPSDGSRAVRVTGQAAGFAPLIELWAPSGELLATGNQAGRLIGLLPAAGDSLLSVRAAAVTASGPYTLTVQPVEALPGPEACYFRSDAIDFLPVRVGSTVILALQRPISGDSAWDPARNAYIGRPAQVTYLNGTDEQGCPIVAVDIDQGQFYWRVRDLVVIESGE